MSEEQVFTQCTVGGPVRVYVEDGVIKRMRPIIFDEDDAPSWTIEARGRKFTPPRKTTLQSYEVPERTRVYTILEDSRHGTAGDQRRREPYASA